MHFCNASASLDGKAGGPSYPVWPNLAQAEFWGYVKITFGYDACQSDMTDQALHRYIIPHDFELLRHSVNLLQPNVSYFAISPPPN